MIKQIKSSEIKNFLTDNKNVELLDVRTQEEWDNIGRPDGEKLGLKTHFVTIVRSLEPSANKNFIENSNLKLFFNLIFFILTYLIVTLRIPRVNHQRVLQIQLVIFCNVPSFEFAHRICERNFALFL